MKKRIYLDAAAAHPVRKDARRAFLQTLHAYGNPSAPHEEGREAARMLEKARESIAKEVGAKADAVIFTSGATESNALAIIGLVNAKRASGTPSEHITILYLPSAHASTLSAIETVRSEGVVAREIPLSGFSIDMKKLEEMLREGAHLVTLDGICSETGTRFDVRAVRTIIDSFPLSARPVIHVDATQMPLTEKIDRTRIGADLITFDAQKIGGVRGIGALIAPRAVALSPVVAGGGQERGLRGGTPSPALASSFATALRASQKEREAFSARALVFKKMIQTAVSEISGTYINEGKEQAPNILNISFVGRDTDYLCALLNEEGCAISTKSACETDTLGSRVVRSFTHDEARAASTLRISLHAKNNVSEIRKFIRALKKSIAFIDKP